jgi:uncharacterized membrane protein (DUF106 family)
VDINVNYLFIPPLCPYHFHLIFIAQSVFVTPVPSIRNRVVVRSHRLGNCGRTLIKFSANVIEYVANRANCPVLRACDNGSYSQ